MSSFKDQYLDNQENTKQMFLFQQTIIENCDHMVVLFILYQKIKDNKRKVCLIQSSISQKQAEQTAGYFSEQTWPCTAEGEPGEEDCSNEAGGYCPVGEAKKYK